MKKLQIVVVIIVSFIVPFLLAWYVLDAIEPSIGANLDVTDILVALFLFLIFSVGSYYLNVFMHEIGHLILGLFCGFSFVSLRFGKVTIIKSNGRYSVKKYKISGTAGQCLMCPPPNKVSTFGILAYNYGGALFNLVIGILSFALLFVTSNYYFILPLIFSLFFFFISGMPVKFLNIQPDGYLALELIKSEDLRTKWENILIINRNLTNGFRLNEMSKELFDDSLEIEKINDIYCMTLLASASRHMDDMLFDKAERLYDYLLSVSTSTIYENEVLCEALFINILKDKDCANVDTLFEKAYPYIEMNSWHPAKQRILFAYYFLHKKDDSKAQDCLLKFQNVLHSYPLLGEVRSERELVKYINSLA